MTKSKADIQVGGCIGKKTNDKKNCNPINNLPLINGCKCHLVFNVFINDKFLQLQILER